MSNLKIHKNDVTFIVGGFTCKTEPVKSGLIRKGATASDYHVCPPDVNHPKNVCAVSWAWPTTISHSGIIHKAQPFHKIRSNRCTLTKRARLLRPSSPQKSKHKLSKQEGVGEWIMHTPTPAQTTCKETNCPPPHQTYGVFTLVFLNAGIQSHTISFDNTMESNLNLFLYTQPPT